MLHLLCAVVGSGCDTHCHCSVLICCVDTSRVGVWDLASAPVWLCEWGEVGRQSWQHSKKLLWEGAVSVADSERVAAAIPWPESCLARLSWLLLGENADFSYKCEESAAQHDGF